MYPRGKPHLRMPVLGSASVFIYILALTTKKIKSFVGIPVAHIQFRCKKPRKSI